MSDIEKRIQNILEHLEQVNDDLLALSDDIWLSINHNDNKVLGNTIEFKTLYNDKVAEFNRLSEDISLIVRDYIGLNKKNEIAIEINSRENERIIKSLDKNKKHFLVKDFTYKRPMGFSISGKAFNNVRTWKILYQLTLKYLHGRFNDFNRTTTDDSYISTQGNPEELALTLNGKKSNIRRKDFQRFGENAGLVPKQISNVFSRLQEKKDDLQKVIEHSFLSTEMKDKYQELLNERYTRLFECGLEQT